VVSKGNVDRNGSRHLHATNVNDQRMVGNQTRTGRISRSPAAKEQQNASANVTCNRTNPSDRNVPNVPNRNKSTNNLNNQIKTQN